MRHASSGAHPGRRAVRWSFIVLANGVALLAIGVSTIRESYQEWQVDQEIQAMRSQVDALEGRKLQLADLIQQLNSSQILDREARARLGLRKPDEHVIVVPSDPTGPVPPTLSYPAVPSAASADVSNPKKWFRYFFGS